MKRNDCEDREENSSQEMIHRLTAGTGIQERERPFLPVLSGVLDEKVEKRSAPSPFHARFSLSRPPVRRFTA